MAAPYNEAMVQQMIIDGLTPLGRGGQTRLAEAVGVRVQTVNKWVKRQTTPEPDKWPAIERFFGFTEGEFHRRAIGTPPDIVSTEDAQRVTYLLNQVFTNLNEIAEGVERNGLGDQFAPRVEGISRQTAELADRLRTDEPMSVTFLHEATAAVQEMAVLAEEMVSALDRAASVADLALAADTGKLEDAKAATDPKRRRTRPSPAENE